MRARGVETLTLFGSVARGDATSTSDVDLAIRPGAGFSLGGLDHFGRRVVEPYHSPRKWLPGRICLPGFMPLASPAVMVDRDAAMGLSDRYQA